MSRGFKRVSAAVWTAVALLSVIRVPAWAILHDQQGREPVLYAAAILLPLVLHLVTVWIIKGFDRSS